jgi:predicted ABC-type transport system involved in lysophospholipase L1 biosynthesis ATPase subunit
MIAGRPVLEIENAQAKIGPEGMRILPITLQLMRGDLALVEARDPELAAWFADMCSGLVPLAEGSVRFMDHDWSKMPRDYAAALRGRIGRVFAAGGWIEFADMAANILLPQLHHTRSDVRVLREEAAKLAYAFGLPGLPMGQVRDLPAMDLARAACIRAFLGEPQLLLLESPLQGRFDDLLVPLLEALAVARQNGAAAIWLSNNEQVWRDRSVPASHRLRLRDYGLVPVRRAA